MYPCGGAFCPPDSQDALRTFGDRKNQKSMGVIEETMKLSLVQPNFSFFCLPGFPFPLTLHYCKASKADKCVSLFPLKLSVQLQRYDMVQELS